MEKVIDIELLDSILTGVNIDVEKYGELVDTLYYYSIEIDMKGKEISKFKTLEKDVKKLRIIERISLFLLSNYTNAEENEIDSCIIERAMELSGQSFEKLYKYIKMVNVENINEQKIVNKGIRTLLRAAISYQIAYNQPNCEYILNLLESEVKVLEENKDDSLSEVLELYYFSIMILKRNFWIYLKKINDVWLIEILKNLQKYTIEGKSCFIETSLKILEDIKEKEMRRRNSYRFWLMKYMYISLLKFKERSVWSLLYGKYSNEYIVQLIKSKPPILELWPNQAKIINDKSGLLNEKIRKFVISYPTSGGKSLIAELAIVRELEKDLKKTCFYIVPTNALVHEVSKRLKDRFRRLLYKVGDTINLGDNIIDGKSDCYNVVVTTPEKLSQLISNNIKKDYISKISLIVFDEFHKISDKKRGWFIESSISYLISINNNIKMIILSAIMNNGKEICEWIDNGNNDSTYIDDLWTPAQIVKAIVNYDYKKCEGRWIEINKSHPWSLDDYNCYLAEANIKYIEDIKGRISEKYRISMFNFPRYHDKNYKVLREKNLTKENFILGVAQKLMNIGGCLIFFNTKDECEQFIKKYNPFFEDKVVVSDEIKKLIKYVDKRLGCNHLLVKALNNNMAFHHSSLPVDIREALEDYFSKGYIKILISTTTLAEGVNFPIQNFIYSGKKHNNQRVINISDFKNIAGRVGRAYQSTYGQVVFIDYYNKGIDEEYIKFNSHKNIITSSIANYVNLDEELSSFTKFEPSILEESMDDDIILNFIKSLLLFYNEFGNDEDNIDLLIDNTLLAKQINTEKLEIVKTFSRKVFNSFNEKDKQYLEEVQVSGLSFDSYNKIYKISEDIYFNIVNKKISEFSFKEIITKEVFNKILKVKECIPKLIRRSTANSRKVNINEYLLLIDWIDSNLSLVELSEKYFFEVDEEYKMARFTEYVKDMYEYKLPWIIGIIVSIIKGLAKKDNKENYIFLDDFPIYIMYGITTKEQVDLALLGIESRDTIKDLNKFIIKNYNYNDLEELSSIIKFIEPMYLLNNDNNLTEYETRKIIAISNSLKESTNIIERDGNIVTSIAGTKYYLCQLANRDVIVNDLKKNGNKIKLIQEHSNYYDKFAVAIYYLDNKIGYIPRKYNEEISYYLELYKQYNIYITNVKVIDFNKYIDISIKIEFNLF